MLSEIEPWVLLGEGVGAINFMVNFKFCTLKYIQQTSDRCWKPKNFDNWPNKAAGDSFENSKSSWGSFET